MKPTDPPNQYRTLLLNIAQAIEDAVNVMTYGENCITNDRFPSPAEFDIAFNNGASAKIVVTYECASRK